MSPLKLIIEWMQCLFITTVTGEHQGEEKGEQSLSIDKSIFFIIKLNNSHNNWENLHFLGKKFKTEFFSNLV